MVTFKTKISHNELMLSFQNKVTLLTCYQSFPLTMGCGIYFSFIFVQGANILLTDDGSVKLGEFRHFGLCLLIG